MRAGGQRSGRRPGWAAVAGAGTLALGLWAVTGAASTGSAGSSAAPSDRSPSSPAASAVPTPSASTPTPRAATSTRTVVVALGDSVPQGAGCSGCVPYPQEFADHLQHSSGTAVQLINDAVGGSTSSDLLEQVSGAVATDVARADVVLIQTGANDYGPQRGPIAQGSCGGADGLACTSPTTAQVRENMISLLSQVERLHAGRQVTVVVLDYWNVFEDGEVADTAYGHDVVLQYRNLTRQANAAICAAASSTGAPCVDLFEPWFEHDPTALLADDGDHPNQAGHDLIASLLERL